MSASLATLAPDCIANLIHYLNGNEFVSLMKTGNRLLRHKLSLNCNGLRFEEPPSSKFPFPALKLAKLKSLSVFAVQDVSAYMDFRNGGELALAQGSKSIEMIDLRFRNSPGLFLAPGRSVPRLLVRDRFPSLATLILHDYVCEESLESLFGELPEKLTTLSLKPNGAERVRCELSSITKLPRHLTSLTLDGFMLEDPSERDFKLETLFPPNLVHLELDSLREPTLLGYLPPTLTNIRYSVHSVFSPLRWPASRIPKGLAYFRASPAYRDLLYRFSGTLEIEPFVGDCKLYEKPLDFLPKSLKVLPSDVWTMSLFAPSLKSELCRESIVKHFINLEEAVIDQETTIEYLPVRLKHLRCFQALHIKSPLPNSLISLRLSEAIPSDNLDNIPASLQSLTIGFESPARPVSISTDFPPWKYSDFAQFASKMSIVSLAIEWNRIYSGPCLEPLAKMETLRKFQLIRIASAWAETAKWLPKCLPYNLNELRLVYWHTQNGRQVPVPEDSSIDDFIAPCNLNEACPNLRTLAVTFTSGKRVTFGSCFATLPRGLRILEVYFPSADLELGVVSQLPRSLLSLKLSLGRQSNEDMSPEHFKGLPESLVEIILSTGTQPAMEDWTQILPRSVTVAFWTENTTFKPYREFMDSHPLSEGFRFQPTHSPR